MELKNSIKEVVSGIYHMVLDGSDNCSMHGKSITDYISENSLQPNSILILDGSSNNCRSECDKSFLESITEFLAISYIVGDKPLEQTKWEHAYLISRHNIGTRYFNTYEDAYSWSKQYQMEIE